MEVAACDTGDRVDHRSVSWRLMRSCVELQHLLLLYDVLEFAPAQWLELVREADT